MAASANDKFQKVAMSTATTLSAPGFTSGGTSMNVVSTTNWPTDTGVTFAVDEVTTVDGVETRTAGTYNIFRGTVASATSITNITYVGGDAARSYSAGASTRVYILVSYAQMNRLIDGILVEHNQDGTHGAMTADSLTVDGALAVTGASTLTGALTVKSWDGWIQPTDTWTYVSATSFKITGSDVSAKFPVGTKIKLTQTTAKYFYVTACSFSTDTTVTITGGSDYSLANAAITSPNISYMDTPQGFPDWFNWTPTYANLSGGTLNFAKFDMRGKTVFWRWQYTLAGAGVGTSPTVSLPVTAHADYSNTTIIDYGIINFRDVSAPSTYRGVARANSTTTLLLSYEAGAAGSVGVSSATATAPVTFATGDILGGEGFYEAA